MKFLRLFNVERLRAREWYVPGTYVYINAATILAMNDIMMNIGGEHRPVTCITVGATNEDDVTFYVAHEAKEILAAMGADCKAVANLPGIAIGKPVE